LDPVLQLNNPHARGTRVAVLLLRKAGFFDFSYWRLFRSNIGR
jgi:hypothetical protein